MHSISCAFDAPKLLLIINNNTTTNDADVSLRRHFESHPFVAPRNPHLLRRPPSAATAAMGNCAPKTKPGSSPPSAKPLVRLYGSDSCPVTSRLRVALLYKNVRVQLVPSESPAAPFLRCDGDTVVGTPESLFRYVDSKFPQLPSAPAIRAEDRDPSSSSATHASAVTVLQHRSAERHLEGFVRWAERVIGGGGGVVGEKAEARRLWQAYGRFVEVMLEHAQMEERLLFPAMDAALSRGVCKEANEEHARNLPTMNGIKEDIKSLVAMDAGTPFYHEALLNLSLRFKTLQDHCKKHFQGEETKLLPLLETVIKIRKEEEGGNGTSSPLLAERVIEQMEATHSHLFPFFMSGLLPDEAMRYIDLVCCRSTDRRRLGSMLRSLIASLESRNKVSSNYEFPLQPL